ncbi:MAG TPA: poly(R)-hydroxyalkanoic acid synthase subunit PhaE [Steroidobacteraceae bacterium]
MPEAGSRLPWMSAWLNVQQQLSQIAAGAAAAGSDPGADAMRRLMEFGRDYTGIAAAFWSQMQSKEPDYSGLQSGLIERYRRLFMPVVAAAAAPAETGAAFIRSQRAAERFGRHASAIAIDASERLTAALSATGPDAPPIASLRELHELWIECGEAAYAAAAHREDFAEAQAEFLAAMVELRSGELRR